ncbi:uncharacterized protein LOC124361451 isoform X2 [Homalodisca vitripennis]|uniref:uncharacterized protein LOC124361451 isoform X2 n=1 Tax=Homalodisca vitripennis TaxID=197043 RepID=UPI001EEC5DD0|nr:uncharacterized protein LOC124361451 isoform X2 [Homalodisca vitripennis]
MARLLVVTLVTAALRSQVGYTGYIRLPVHLPMFLQRQPPVSGRAFKDYIHNSPNMLV